MLRFLHRRRPAPTFEEVQWRVMKRAAELMRGISMTTEERTRLLTPSQQLAILRILAKHPPGQRRKALSPQACLRVADAVAFLSIFPAAAAGVLAIVTDNRWWLVAGAIGWFLLLLLARLLLRLVARRIDAGEGALFSNERDTRR